jgi:hypothetical protein
VLAASIRFVPKNTLEEPCPFCLTAPAQTQRSFATHVGRHLQDISLAALPNLNLSPDSEEEEEGDTDGDDDNDNEDSKDTRFQRLMRLKSLGGVILSGRFMAFREIAELPSPAERIQAMNVTRDRFAATEIGLTDWIEILLRDGMTPFPRVSVARARLRTR